MANNKKIINKLYELRSYYLDKMDLIDPYIELLKTTEYNANIEQNLKNLILGFFRESRNIMQFDSGKKEIFEMYGNIEKLYCFNKKLDYDINSNTYKLFPFIFDRNDPIYLDLCDKVSMKIIDDFLNGTDFLKAIKKEAQVFANNVNKTKTSLNNTTILPYYGDTQFLVDRMFYITSCMEKVSIDNNIDPALRDQFQHGYDEANAIIFNMNSQLYKGIDKREEYIIVEKAYIEMMNLENNYAKLLQPVWKQYLTDPRDYKEGEEYHFLLHSVTGGHVDEQNLTKICATLGTDKCNPAYPSDIGYIMDFDMDLINNMSYSDAGSFPCSKTEYIDRGCPSNWQLAEKISPNCYVYYEYSNISKLLLPWTMEEILIKRQEEAANDPRPQNIYSEIFFYRNQKPIKILGYFAQTDRGLDMLQEINANGELPVIDFRNIKNKVK